MNQKRYCGHCHTCGAPIKDVLDGEEWCDRCGVYRRYISHGWSNFSANDASPCPDVPATTETIQVKEQAT